MITLLSSVSSEIKQKICSDLVVYSVSCDLDSLSYLFFLIWVTFYLWIIVCWGKELQDYHQVIIGKYKIIFSRNTYNIAVQIIQLPFSIKEDGKGHVQSGGL